MGVLRNSKALKLSILFVTMMTLIIFSINTYLFFRVWEKTFDSIIPYERLENFTHQFNLYKAIQTRGYKNSKDNINIDLSAEDLKVFQSYYYESIFGLGYLDDASNEWRKSSITLPEKNEQKIQIKIHGTSTTPVRKSLSFINSLRYRYLNKIDSNDLDISRGGYAFKIKIKSEDEYYDGARRLNLLSPEDDWSPSTNTINKYIQSLGVISSAGELKNLFINGREIGPYLVIENIGKELLERNYQITNYAILKVNDDWNKGFYVPHISSTDYSSYDLEQSGEMGTIPIAQTAFKNLMLALDKRDIQSIRSYVDIENIAKIAALLNLTGTIHPVSGDNVKYIFDIATGRFKLSYRLEGKVYPLQSYAPSKFNNQNFHGPKNNKLIEILLKERWFLNKRDKYLSVILNDQQKIIQMIENDLLRQSTLLNSSRFPTNQLIHVSKKDIRYIKSNLNVIKNYLNYVKIYITQYRKINNKIQLQILHDSHTPSYLESISTCSNETIKVDPPLVLDVPSYSLEDNYIDINSSINFDTNVDCIKSIEVTKGLKKEKISNQHIYFNHAAEISFIDQSGLNQFGEGLTKHSSNSKKILFTLSEGDYVLSENVVFPAKSSIVFSPGVKIFLHPDVSILIRGPFIANGKDSKKITIKRYESDPFGTFAILGDSSFKPEVYLNHFELSGGSEAILNGVYFSSQMSIHHGNVKINFSKFEESFSDDGLNIKFSPVTIKNSIFQNNTADQIDLDYSDGEVVNNIFNFTKQNPQDYITDGLDISGSKVFIANNIFKNMTDKGISIGEQANVIVFSNRISQNNNGIAVKDGSEMCLVSNEVFDNKIDINSYIKKKMYQLPSLFVDASEDLKLNISKIEDALSSEIPSECKDKIDSITVLK